MLDFNMLSDVVLSTMREEKNKKALNELLAGTTKTLPELTGTPRQIEYAKKVREAVLNKGFGHFTLEYFIGDLEKYKAGEDSRLDQYLVVIFRIAMTLYHYARENKSCCWWLDTFTKGKFLTIEWFLAAAGKAIKSIPLETPFNIKSAESVNELFYRVERASDEELLYRAGLRDKPKAEIEDPQIAEIARQIEKDSVLRPENPVSEIIVEVTLDEKLGVVRVCSDGKIEDMVNVMKEYHYLWNPDKRRWYRKINDVDGAVKDRFVEICRALLDARVIVKIPDLNYIEDIEAGKYESVYPRWVTLSSKDKDAFFILWREGEFRHTVRCIPRVRVRTCSATAPAAEYASVLDFAEQYEFKFTCAAQTLVATAKAAEAAQISVKLKDRPDDTPKLPRPEDRITKLQAEEVQIDDALREEE